MKFLAIEDGISARRQITNSREAKKSALDALFTV